MSVKKYILSLLLFLIIAGCSSASLINGTNAFSKYLIILVYGINENTKVFHGAFGDLKSYLENNLD